MFQFLYPGLLEACLMLKQQTQTVFGRKGLDGCALLAMAPKMTDIKETFLF